MSPSSAEPLACHENLEALLSAGRGRYLHLVAQAAPGYELFANNLDERQLESFELTHRIRPYLNDEKTIRHSNLLAALRRGGSNTFIPSYRSSPYLERWAGEGELSLLSVSALVQHRLEDKLLFQRLLEKRRLPAPEGGAVKAIDEIDQLKHFPVVVQRRWSHGMEGTFLLRSARELRKRLDDGDLKLPLLCRRYHPGIALGITLVVGEEDLLFSALRRQCRGLKERPDAPSGVQWIPRATLGHAARANVEQAMGALGSALRSAGFRGAANIDFVLDGDEPLIIECNPRFSAATPQLSLHPRLLHGLDFFAEHCLALQGRALSANIPFLPDGDYEGTYVDVSEGFLAALRARKKRIVRAVPALGVYTVVGDSLVFDSLDLTRLAKRERALFYYSTGAGEHIGARSDLGALYTNLPLFSAEGGEMQLTALGAALIGGLGEALVAKETGRGPVREGALRPPAPAGPGE